MSGETHPWDSRHPWARYGYAVACRSVTRATGHDEPTLAELADLLEDSLNFVRFQPRGDPKSEAKIPYSYLPSSKLAEVPSQPASKGYFLAPHVTVQDKSVSDLLKAASKLIEELRKSKPAATFDLSLTLVPFAGEISGQSGSGKNQKTGLCEVACCALTTLTRLKPAAYIRGQGNTCLIPDLKVRDLHDFIDTFDRLAVRLPSDHVLYTGLVKQMPLGEEDSESDAADEADADAADGASEGEKETKKSRSFPSPKIRWGNYPEAPQNFSFGPLSLSAALGAWGRTKGELERVQRVVDTLGGRVVYLVSPKNTTQVRLGEHIPEIAQRHNLHKILVSLGWTSYSGLITAQEGKGLDKARDLSRMMAARFVGSFSPHVFRDFIAIRAFYPLALKPLFSEYFG